MSAGDVCVPSWGVILLIVLNGVGLTFIYMSVHERANDIEREIRRYFDREDDSA
jgi:hypothetical protein